MKAMINFRKEGKRSKVLPFSIPGKVANILCDTRIGIVLSYFLYNFSGIKDVTFK